MGGRIGKGCKTDGGIGGVRGMDGWMVRWEVKMHCQMKSFPKTCSQGIQN